MVPVSRACVNNLYEKREQQYDDANKYTTEQFLVLRKNLAHVLSGTTTPAHSLSSHPHVEVQVCRDFPSPAMPFKGTIIHTASWKSRTKGIDGWLGGYEIRFDTTQR